MTNSLVMDGTAVMGMMYVFVTILHTHEHLLGKSPHYRCMCGRQYSIDMRLNIYNLTEPI